MTTRLRAFAGLLLVTSIAINTCFLLKFSSATLGNCPPSQLNQTLQTLLDAPLPNTKSARQGSKLGDGCYHVFIDAGTSQGLLAFPRMSLKMLHSKAATSECMPVSYSSRITTSRHGSLASSSHPCTGPNNYATLETFASLLSSQTPPT